MIEVLSLALPLALTAGVNPYLTVFLLGLSHQFGMVESMPAGLEPLTTIPVLVVAGVLTAVEFLADKVPFVDTLWGTLNTLIAPIGAILISSGLISELDPTLGGVIVLASGGAALTSRLSKLGFRVFVNASPEPASNSVVSVAEDVGVFALTYFALNNPVVALVIAVVILAVLLITLPVLYRWSRYWYRALRARFGRRQRESDALPDDHAALLPTAPILTSHTGARGLNGRSRFGYLSLLPESLAFTYDPWLREVQVWRLPLDRIETVNFRRGFLSDVLTLYYHDERGRPQAPRFVFLKDRSPLAGRFAAIEERIEPL
jgi:hypothetical protein